jgi:5-methylcytosine-specific restriction enzyme A
MRNPKWSRDELILVLHLYLQNPKSPPSKDSKEVFEMSETLRKLNAILGGDTNAKYRNPNGVYMKMMNFRRFDDSVDGTGLTRGGKDDRIVWELYSQKPEELSGIVKNIKEIIDSDIKLPEPLEEIDEEDSEEGEISTRTHKNRERNQKVVKKKKERFLKENGKLFCEACEFDFNMTYGSRGDGFIECHHIKHLSDIDGTTKTKLSDLVLLCANCHRMIHRKKPWLSMEQLKILLRIENGQSLL